jgi:hypothetical protein
MNITEIKRDEFEEIQDFCESLREYGHIYHYPPEKLDEPFNKIMEGIKEIQRLMDDSWEM